MRKTVRGTHPPVLEPLVDEVGCAWDELAHVPGVVDRAAEADPAVGEAGVLYPGSGWARVVGKEGAYEEDDVEAVEVALHRRLVTHGADLELVH
jgi:hypothetical protein